MRKKQSRKGFSLIELLVAIVVLAILGTITITAGTAAQRRARVTSAMTVFSDYRSAFNTAIMDHPGLVNDREELWVGPDGTDTGVMYTSKEAFKRLVGYMNSSLSADLQLVPSADGPYYESKGNDPWGGKYVMLEYPDIPGGLSYYDPTQPHSKATICMSIWCTGVDSDIIIPDENGLVTVRDFSVGIAVMDHAGDLSSETHGSTDVSKPFLGATMRLK